MRERLTKSEMAIMEILWEEGKGLTATEIVNIAGEKKTWKDSSIHLLINKLLDGENIALISDAGMPGISDPGEDLIKQAIENNIEIDVLPGATAFTVALVGSGLDTHKFVFEGFLDRDKKLRRKRLEEIQEEDRTMIFYESPHRLKDTLKDMLKFFGNRKIAVLGDMFELGEFAEEIHRKVGIEVFTHKIDVLVTVGELAKYIADEVKYLGMPKEKVIAVDTTKEAIEYLNKNLAKDDVVLLKAANGMHFAEIFKGINN